MPAPTPPPTPTGAYVTHTPVTQITFRTWNQNQSWHYERVIKMGDHKLRINGRHNAYQNQSYISIERWDGTKWQHIQTIAGAVMASWTRANFGPGGPESQYTRKTISNEMLSAFEVDEDELVEAAAAILL